MRKLLLVVALAAVALVAGGQLLEARAEARVHRAVAARVDHVGDVELDLGGLLVGYHLATGRLPAIDLAASDVVVGDPSFAFDTVDVHLEDVAVDTADLLQGEVPELRPASGSVTAVLPEAELTQLLLTPRPGWRVDLTPDGVRAIGEVQGVEVEVLAGLAVRDGALVLTSTRVSVGGLGAGAEAAVAAAFDTSLPLPRLPGDLVLTDARVERRDGRDVVVLRAEITGPVRLSP